MALLPVSQFRPIDKEIAELINDRINISEVMQKIKNVVDIHRPYWKTTAEKSKQNLYIPASDLLPRSIQYNYRDGSILVHFNKTKLGDKFVDENEFTNQKMCLNYNTLEVLVSNSMCYGRSQMELKKYEMLRGIKGMPQVHSYVNYRNKNGIDKTRIITKPFSNEKFYNKSLIQALVQNKLSFSQKFSIAKKLLKMLYTLHEKGIVNTVVSPKYISLDKYNNPVFTNLLSCKNDDFISCMSREFVAGLCPPEFAKAVVDSNDSAIASSCNSKRDVWALGIIFHLMFISETLLWQENSVKTPLYDLNAKPASIEDISDLCQEGINSRFEYNQVFPQKNENTIEHIIWKMLQKDPENRLTIGEALQKWERLEIKEEDEKHFSSPINRSAPQSPELNKNLETVLKSSNLSFEQKIIIARKLLTDLSKLHEKGIVHRDIKWSNITLDNDHNPTIIDKGLSCSLDDHEAKKSGAGTILLCSPELARAGIEEDEKLIVESCTPSRDIWALGLVFYTMFISESIPWSDEGPLNPWDQCEMSIEHISQLQQNDIDRVFPKPAPETIDYVIWEMLRVDPKKRISTPMALKKLIAIEKEISTQQNNNFFNVGKKFSTYQTLNQISKYIEKNRTAWEEESKKQGRSLYFPSSKDLPRPVQYDTDGSIFVHFNKFNKSLWRGFDCILDPILDYFKIPDWAFKQFVEYKDATIALEYPTGKAYASMPAKNWYASFLLDDFKDVDGIPGILNMRSAVAYRNKKGKDRVRFIFEMHSQEFYKFQNLSTLVNKNLLSIPEKIQIAINLLTTLSELHKKGLILRRLNPETIFIDKTTSYITDLSLIYNLHKQRDAFQNIFFNPLEYSPENDLSLLGDVLLQMFLPLNQLSHENFIAEILIDMLGMNAKYKFTSATDFLNRMIDLKRIFGEPSNTSTEDYMHTLSIKKMVSSRRVQAPPRPQPPAPEQKNEETSNQKSKANQKPKTKPKFKSEFDWNFSHKDESYSKWKAKWNEEFRRSCGGEYFSSSSYSSSSSFSFSSQSQRKKALATLELDSKVQDLKIIKKKYHELALKYHPDKAPLSKKQEYTEKFRNIREAYEILSNSL